MPEMGSEGVELLEDEDDGRTVSQAQLGSGLRAIDQPREGGRDSTAPVQESTAPASPSNHVTPRSTDGQTDGRPASLFLSAPASGVPATFGPSTAPPPSMTSQGLRWAQIRRAEEIAEKLHESARRSSRSPVAGLQSAVWESCLCPCPCPVNLWLHSLVGKSKARVAIATRRDETRRGERRGRGRRGRRSFMKSKGSETATEAEAEAEGRGARAGARQADNNCEGGGGRRRAAAVMRIAGRNSGAAELSRVE